MDVSYALDYPSVPAGEARRLHLLVRIETWPEEGGRTRKPLNVALVIDRSGSMEGEKLAFTKDAALGLLEELTPNDLLSVVSYGDSVAVHLAPTPVTDKESIRSAIEGIKAEGTTNLSGGWLRGLSLLGEHKGEEFLHRALLLTDGLANRGVTNLDVLADIARQHREKGIATTTIGFGTEFNEDLLVAMAQEGGGRFYLVKHPEEAPGVFLQEFGELSRVFGQNLELTLQAGEGVGGPEFLGELPAEPAEGSVTIILGDIHERDRKQVLFALALPGGLEPGRTEVGTVHVRYDAVRGKVGERRHVLPVAVTVGGEGAAAGPDPEVTREVVLYELARAKKEAARRLEGGDPAGARSSLETAQRLASEHAGLDPDAFAREEENLRRLAEDLGLGERVAEAKKALSAQVYDFHGRRGAYRRMPDVDVRTFTITPETREEALDVVESVRSVLGSFGHEEALVARAEYVCRELIENALEHGCREQAAPRAEVEIRASRSYFRLTVEDNGAGFDAQGTLEREEKEAAGASEPRGRGLLSVKQAADELRFSSRGNRVTALLRKQRFQVGVKREALVDESGVGELGLITVQGPLDSHTHEGLAEEFDAATKGGVVSFVVDLSKCEYISSAGMGVFMSASHTAEEKGGKVVIVGVRPSVREVFHLLGIEEMLSFAETVEAARKLFGQA